MNRMLGGIFLLVIAISILSSSDATEEIYIRGLAIPVEVKSSSERDQELKRVGFAETYDFLNQFFEAYQRLSWVSLQLEKSIDEFKPQVAEASKIANDLVEKRKKFLQNLDASKNKSIIAEPEVFAEIVRSSKEMSASAEHLDDWLRKWQDQKTQFNSNVMYYERLLMPKAGDIRYPIFQFGKESIDLLSFDDRLKSQWGSQMLGWNESRESDRAAKLNFLKAEAKSLVPFFLKASQINFDKLKKRWGPLNGIQDIFTSFLKAFPDVNSAASWLSEPNNVDDSEVLKKRKDETLDFFDPQKVSTVRTALKNIIEENTKIIKIISEKSAEALNLPVAEVRGGISELQKYLIENPPPFISLSISSLQKVSIDLRDNLSASKWAPLKFLLVEADRSAVQTNVNVTLRDLKAFDEKYREIYLDPNSPWRKNFEVLLNNIKEIAPDAAADQIEEAKFLIAFQDWFEGLRVEILHHRYVSAEKMILEMEERVKKLSKVKVVTADKDFIEGLNLLVNIIPEARALIQMNPSAKDTLLAETKNILTEIESVPRYCPLSPSAVSQAKQVISDGQDAQKIEDLNKQLRSARNEMIEKMIREKLRR